MLLKRTLQRRSNLCRATDFNIAALHHVNQLPVAQQSDRWRRWRIPGEVTARSFRSLTVLSGKHSNHTVRMHAMLNGGANSRAHSSGSTSADRVHYHHDGSLL